MESEPSSASEDWPVVVECGPDAVGELLDCPGVFWMIVTPGWRAQGHPGQYRIEPSDGRDFGIEISVLPRGRGDFVERARELIENSAERIVGVRDAARIAVTNDGKCKRVSGRLVDGEDHEWFDEVIKVGRHAILVTGIAPVDREDWHSEVRRMVESVTPAPRGLQLRRRRGRR